MCFRRLLHIMDIFFIPHDAADDLYYFDWGTFWSGLFGGG
jgi:hypothetical protein